MRRVPRRQLGYTLLELLIAAGLAAALLAGLAGMTGNLLESGAEAGERTRLNDDLQFALNHMARTVAHSRRLLLPLADNPDTDWPENLREQTVPASPPVGSSTLATAVLAVTLPAYVDLDGNGIPDADDDGDGRIDEDLPNDGHHDFQPGIMLVDDDGDGSVDEGGIWDDDDEDGAANDDPQGGSDDDGDGAMDEDAASDANGDGCPGLCGVDDNGDGSIDTDAIGDDDEDGSDFEDPWDPVVYYLAGDVLYERMPVPWNEDGISLPDGPVDGRDFVASAIAEGVSLLRFERVATQAWAPPLVRITIELRGASGATVTGTTDVRTGGAL